MGRELVATMADVGNRTRAGPLLDWLWAACVRLGANAACRVKSLVNQNFEPTTPDARVVTCMQRKLAPYLLPCRRDLGCQPCNGNCRRPAHWRSRKSDRPGGKENTRFWKPPKSKQRTASTDAQWDADFPELYRRMSEEGRTTARIKVLLEDIFRPADLFSLESIQLNVTGNMAKEVKNLDYWYNNDVSYESSHRGISPFAVIGVSMATSSRRCPQEDQYYTRTSNLTLTEGVSMADTNPDPIPTEYRETSYDATLRSYTILWAIVWGTTSKCEG
jgi:hypothetical protein